MTQDIISTIVEIAVLVLVGIVSFSIRKLAVHDSDISVLKQQHKDREKHLDQQLQGLTNSIERIEGLLIEALSGAKQPK